MAEVEVCDEVAHWLLSLGPEESERAIAAIDRLAALGWRARMPLSRSLGQGLFELRFSLRSTSQRITYRFTSDGKIVLLTAFSKQRDNEASEISRARRKAADDAAT